MDTAGAALRPRLRLDVRAAYRAGGQGLRLRLPEDRIRRAGRRAGHQLRMGAMPGSLSERSEEHTSELQSLMRISYAAFCLKKKNNKNDRPKLPWYISSTQITNAKILSKTHI